jgi:5-methyltetrahydrofolate--homocysteine methyltransferase
MILNRILETLQKGDVKQIAELIGQALDSGMTPEKVLNQGLIAGMDVVGQKFQTGEIYIPHMLLAARAMHAALDILKPLLAESGNASAGRVVLGTVQGDHHDIGKNLVSTMLEGKGFEVIDVGIDALPEKFVAAVDETVQIVAMSALLSTTAPFMGKTIEALERAGVRKHIRIMVGGGAVTQAFADGIGADAYGADAAAAALLAMALVSHAKESR